MQHHLIIRMLGIKDPHVVVWDWEESEEGFLYELHTKIRTQRCPKCKERTKKVHGYRHQNLQTVKLSEKRVTLRLKKRRYKCKSCDRTFFETLSFVNRYQRQTTMLQQSTLLLTSKMSFTEVARLVGMSTNRVIRLFDRQPIKAKKVLPRAIAIDEFKGDAGGEKYQTIIVDVEKKQVIDILPNRRKETIESYFRDCDTGRVEIVVMDLSKAFKDAVREVLGDPIIIADRFHYMRQVYWAFDEVRRHVQKELSKKDRIGMKRSKELLWKSPTKLSEEGKKKVESLLSLDSKLCRAYELKNKLDPELFIENF